jgi:dolichol-phosphate mannosyltransferase
VYKAEACLRELHKRLQDSLIEITSDFEIVLVEDCGGDSSWKIIEELAAQDPRVKGIQFSRNFGQHYGITAGLDYCTGDWAIVMDCDLQDPPEAIPELYAQALQGYDVVLVRRRHRKDSRMQRLTSYLFFKVFNYLADTRYDGQVGNFRIISRKVVTSYCGMRERLRFFGGLVDWMGFPSATIDIEHNERYSGQSTYSFRKRWKLASEIIIAYSDKPLRLSAKFGLLIALLAVVYGLYIFTKALFFNIPVPGWSSLIVSLYFLGGIIIFNLGILGIYLGKVFDEIKARPLYLVRNCTSTVCVKKDTHRYDPDLKSQEHHVSSRLPRVST